MMAMVVCPNLKEVSLLSVALSKKEQEQELC